MNADKTEYMLFNQVAITLNGGYQKIVDKFTYLGNSVVSSESDINRRLVKARTNVDWLSIIWTSDLSDKIKRGFSQATIVPILQYRWTIWTLAKEKHKKVRRELHKNPTSYIEQHPTKQHLWNHPRKMDKTYETILEKIGRKRWRSLMDPFKWRCQF